MSLPATSQFSPTFLKYLQHSKFKCILPYKACIQESLNYKIIIFAHVTRTRGLTFKYGIRPTKYPNISTTDQLRHVGLSSWLPHCVTVPSLSLSLSLSLSHPAVLDLPPDSFCSAISSITLFANRSNRRRRRKRERKGAHIIKHQLSSGTGTVTVTYC